jgi:uncharacterized protein YndB with AHSA1/START domain
MSSTRIERHLAAPRQRVYAALLDAGAVARWMVPPGMRSEVHAFEPWEGGTVRISLTYDAPDARGKTTAHTDTHRGRFLQLVPDEKVVQAVEFETDDPAMQGEMTITYILSDAADGGTELLAIHDDVPAGIAPADNELGWRLSLDQLAELVAGDGRQ